MAIVQNVSIVLAVLASLAAVLYRPVTLRVEVLGLNRPASAIQNIHGEDFQILPDTLYCEDLHHHLPSGLLFGASEEKAETRRQWFPPIGRFNDSHALDRGTIIVIDPETKTTKRLTLTNFPRPFITHGIDIYSPPSFPNTVYIFAINHLPNPAYASSNGTILPAARSQIELFQHTIGSSSATHLRSIWHPQIRTPNDIYAINETSIYVTNDHYYRSGELRTLEDVGFHLTPWSNIIHLSLSPISSSSSSEGITATIALPSIQNPNGLGHGKNPNEILINRAAAGVMAIAHPNLTHPHLKIAESVQIPNTLDNPSYFSDSYAKSTGKDASGYVLAGLAEASKFPSKEGDPVVVWLVQPSSEEGIGKGEGKRRKLFQDDGRTISTASTAVLVAIDPQKNGGKKQAWLFVTGPISMNAVSLRVDL